jgi:opacity protein-like surface antigen
MLGKRLALCTLAAAAAFAVTAARAADYTPPPPPPPPIYIPPPIEEVSAWYLRGDIGFSNQSVGSLYSGDYSNYDSVSNVQKSFDAAPFFGIGVGYYFNNWLRFDVTGEYRGNANFHGFDLGVAGGSNWPDNYTGSKSEWTFLANGYVDLGTWSNFTPFIGAGVGASRNTISNFTDVNPTNGVWSDAYGDTASQWSLAWALYAGVGYKVSKNVTIELAYRYLDLGNATTGPVHTYDNSCQCTPLEFHHLTSNDFKLGVRFNLDAFYEAPRPIYYQPPQVYAPPPVYQVPPPVYQPPPPLRSRG